MATAADALVWNVPPSPHGIMKINLVYEIFDNDAANVDDVSALFTTLEQSHRLNESRKRPRSPTSSRVDADSHHVDEVSAVFTKLEDAYNDSIPRAKRTRTNETSGKYSLAVDDWEAKDSDESTDMRGLKNDNILAFNGDTHFAPF
ncbi:hypothetical protein H310_14285 [Aphanomyces invadans]|uniref:Uncharacterized protein n=1 Tax=Aphanomyces invadans TaxID=157072 RepID=A0A024TA69_9STRA|nr:hypothetical protein H310_14285 [Aphanomyces invadans]ETV91045.1 hypothetical protein H310_14285 [Aphanomyces invadans]|eukprot:XP_008880325.1 hypothetical protein H310_14285 [Aphanomyces invadans]